MVKKMFSIVANVLSLLGRSASGKPMKGNRTKPGCLRAEMSLNYSQMYLKMKAFNLYHNG